MQQLVAVGVHQERADLACHHALVNATAHRYTRASLALMLCAHARVLVFVELDPTTHHRIVAVKSLEVLHSWCPERLVQRVGPKSIYVELVQHNKCNSLTVHTTEQQLTTLTSLMNH